MKKGFTLSEVLITLGIIGIVTALTLPSLVIKYKKNATEVQFMKVVGAIQHANNMARTENGGIELWDACGASSAGEFSTEYIPCISPYMQGYTETLSSATTINGISIPANTPILKTKDGVDIGAGPNLAFKTRKKKESSSCIFTCTDADYDVDPNPKAQYDYVTLGIDLNGINAGANASGKEQFRLAVDTRTGEVLGWFGKQFLSRIKDEGYDNETTWGGKCDASGVTDDAYCGASILDNGGKIIYPW